MSREVPEQQREGLPSRPPLPSDIEDRAAFEELVDASLADVRGAAEKWRAGLAALVTIVTGGLLIKGPSASNDLPTVWRAILTVFAGGGIACAIAGLWFALKAAAGVPREHHYQKIVDDYGSVRVFKLVEAKKGADTLDSARRSLMLALPLLGAAVIFWWWAPTKAPSPPAYVEVELADSRLAACGVLKSADRGRLRLQVSGEEKPRTVPLAHVKNLRVKSSC